MYAKSKQVVIKIAKLTQRCTRMVPITSISFQIEQIVSN
jgi:hypothetical protein